jgi:16S rRNA (cytosine1402-N4)-methyltransferase
MESQVETVHKSVLLEETLELLKAKDGGMFLDCTLGGGGHTAAILAANSANKVIAIDRDPRARARAEERFRSDLGTRLTVIPGRFGEAAALVSGERFDGILADLGMSTDQLLGGTGFSFKDKGELDMRMNPEEGITAQDILNTASDQELREIFYKGGLDRWARKLAKEIIAARPIATAKDFAGIVDIHGGKDARAVAFQALRIAVNREFDEIEGLLQAAPKLAKNGTRLAVITFHSLEDQLVTGQFRKWAGSEAAPAWFGKEESARLGKLLTRKPVTPSDSEVAGNPASRSARLRVFEFSGIG